MSLFDPHDQAQDGRRCGRLISYAHRGRPLLVTGCGRRHGHPWPCHPPPGTARAVRQAIAGPPYGLCDLPRLPWGWLPITSGDTRLIDHPLRARTLEARHLELGLRAAIYEDLPYDLANALNLASKGRP